MTRCAIRYCRNTTKTISKAKFRFFRFPAARHNEHLRLLWRIACGREDLMHLEDTKLYMNHRVCSAHFPIEMISDTNKLHKDAVPILHLFPEKKIVYTLGTQVDELALAIPEFSVFEVTSSNIATQTYQYSTQPSNTILSRRLIKSNPGIQTNVNGMPDRWSTSTQTSASLMAHTPREAKLKEKIKEHEEKIKSLKYELDSIMDDVKKRPITKEEFKDCCDTYLPTFLSNITKTLLDLNDKNLQGRRYTREFKNHAMSIFMKSPSLYKQLVEKYQFPNIRTLMRMKGNRQESIGLSEYVFKSMELKFKTRSDHNKMCVLLIGEMHLNSYKAYKKLIPAKTVVVFMARGLNQKWDQLLGFYFMNSSKSEELKPLVENCILKMFNIGLDVKALVTDSSPNFIELSQSFGISISNCSFMIENRTLYYFFDAPRLLIAVRNIMMGGHKIKFDDCQAEWKYIKQFYEMDKLRDLKMAPNLTDSHIYPTATQKRKVKLAAQVLSMTVSLAMATYVALGELSSAATGTALMIEKFNRCFDILNSSAPETDNEYKKPYTGTPEQEQFLFYMLLNLEGMKVVKEAKIGKTVTHRFKSIKCFQITIKSMISLWNDLKEEGLPCLKTRRLNKDTLETFFKMVRQQSHGVRNPRPSQFINMFQKLSMVNFVDNVPTTYNPITEADKFLMNGMSSGIRVFV